MKKRNLQQRRINRPTRRRRGVVLLVVLSLLTLFVMIGLTYVVVANQYRRSARIYARHRRTEVNPARLMDRVLYQLLRDTKFRSSIRSHGLLGDLYGNDGIKLSVNGFKPLAGGQMLALRVITTSNQPFNPNAALSLYDDYYNGRVLTFVSGPAKGHSTRVLDYFRVGNEAWLRIEALPADRDISQLPLGQQDDGTQVRMVLPNVGDVLLINGQPFNGTGAGYNPTVDANDVANARAFGDPSRQLNQNPNEVYRQLSGYHVGPDGEWGVAGLDDDQRGGVDDPGEAGYPGSDDALTSLLPHIAGFARATRGAIDYGGLDESWDAADFQNAFLAMLPPNPEVANTLPSFHRPALYRYWYGATGNPKQNAWNPRAPNDTNDQDQVTARRVTNAGYRDFRRQIVFRPMPWDHPEFTGSNVHAVSSGIWMTGVDQKWGRAGVDDDGFNGVDDVGEQGWPGSDDMLVNNAQGRGSDQQLNEWLVNGPWDVDNNRDGHPDSVWIDVGLPMQTAPDGTQYKPLVAILCTDLDGRINLNAHGNLQQLASQFKPFNQANPNLDFLGPLTPISHNNQFITQSSPYPFIAGTMTTNKQLFDVPRGLGYGPAEIFFGHIMNPNFAREDYISILRGRYGAFDGGNFGPQPGDAIGQNGDTESIIENIGLPFNWQVDTQGYASPPDVWGRGALVLDHFGQPLAANMGLNGETINSPYELNLSGLGTIATRGKDQPYTIAELEQILRFNDADARSLPSRIVQLAPRSFGAAFPANAIRRALVTTEGRHIPVPAVGLPGSRDFRHHVGASYTGLRSPNIIDLYRARLEDNNVNNVRQLNLEIRKMLSWDLARGQKFNVNRLFGNGRDDNSPPDGVIDDPSEKAVVRDPSQDLTTQREQIWTDPRIQHPGLRNHYFNHTNNDILPALPAQIYARHLFCLMMILKGRADLDLGSGNNTANHIDTIRMLAQWAVNVADFRDPDSIMTGFEYDINPFNGWNVDGDLSSQSPDNGHPDRRVVWGCERPELLITETFAFHDRRTEDLDSPSNKTTDPDPMKRDLHFDQRLLPRSGAFIELFNPWTGSGRKPGEFYYESENNFWRPGVLLNKVNRAGSMVWRMAVIGGRTHAFEGDFDEDPVHRQFVDNDIERTVYFVDRNRNDQSPTPANLLNNLSLELLYLPGAHSTSLVVSPLEPGKYTVIGSPGIGRRAFDSLLTPTRRIRLVPGTRTNQGQVIPVGFTPTVSTPSGTTPGQYSFPDILPATAIVLNQTQLDQTSLPQNAQALPTGRLRSDFSISEPRNGYPATNFVGGLFNPPIDKPLDFDFRFRSQLRTTRNVLQKSETVTNFKTLLLQRLANPLAAYDPLSNPYRTIDTSSFDLQSYNSASRNLDQINAKDSNPIIFKSRQRGGEFNASPQRYGVTGQGFLDYRNLWKKEPPNNPLRVPTVRDPLDPNHINYHLHHSLGYLNHNFYPLLDRNLAPNTDMRGAPATVLPGPDGAWGVANVDDDGINGVDDPGEAGWVSSSGQRSDDIVYPTFPWLTWHNRPFVSHLEVMQVPWTRSSQLLQEFAVRPTTGINPYREFDRSKWQFGHLMNFFQARDFKNTNPTRLEQSLNLYRLFDYIEVPSPYVGTKKRFNPVRFKRPFGPGNDGEWGIANVDDNNDGTVDNPAEAGWPNSDDVYGVNAEYNYLRPPYNWISRFRDPGRINLNTVAVFWDNDLSNNRYLSSPVLEALQIGQSARNIIRNAAGGVLRGDEFVRQFALSRQGFTTSYSVPNSDYPTLFANPFRSAASADLMPMTTKSMRLRSTSSIRESGDIEATFLRSELIRQSSDRRPLFANRRTTSDHANGDSLRNSHFSYQGIQRLGNLASTTSNSYAVWMTMGFFRVAPSPAGPNPAHPDGYVLGRELGAETGSVRRHRAFFILDRSIPVAYEPGENHNVDRAIRLRRFIE